MQKLVYSKWGAKVAVPPSSNRRLCVLPRGFERSNSDSKGGTKLAHVLASSGLSNLPMRYMHDKE